MAGVTPPVPDSSAASSAERFQFLDYDLITTGNVQAIGRLNRLLGAIDVDQPEESRHRVNALLNFKDVLKGEVGKYGPLVSEANDADAIASQLVRPSETMRQALNTLCSDARAIRNGDWPAETIRKAEIVLEVLDTHARAMHGITNVFATYGSEVENASALGETPPSFQDHVRSVSRHNAMADLLLEQMLGEAESRVLR